jgi:hypothetical protein
MKIIKLLILIFTVNFVSTRIAYSQIDWPISPRNQQHWVVGSVGEYRTSNNRFHKGTDISGSGTAYSVNSGTVNSIINKGGQYERIIIDQVIYYHVNSGNYIEEGEEIIVGQEIGIINTAMGHVHIERNNFNYLCNGLSPYLDDITPIINYVEFRRNGASLSSTTEKYNEYITLNGSEYTLLWGKVDIITDAKDPGDNNSRMAPIALSYGVLSNNGTLIGDRVNNFNFRNTPSNNRTSSCFYYGTIQSGIFKYILTSHPISGDADRYFHTRLNKTYAPQSSWPTTSSLDAICNSQSYYSDGIYTLNVAIFDADYQNYSDNNNSDTESVKFLIDNFRPYISNVKIKEYGANEYKYSRGWQWLNNRLLFEPEPTDIKFSSDKDVDVEEVNHPGIHEMDYYLNGLDEILVGFLANTGKSVATFMIDSPPPLIDNDVPSYITIYHAPHMTYGLKKTVCWEISEPHNDYPISIE